MRAHFLLHLSLKEIRYIILIHESHMATTTTLSSRFCSLLHECWKMQITTTQDIFHILFSSLRLESTHGSCSKYFFPKKIFCLPGSWLELPLRNALPNVSFFAELWNNPKPKSLNPKHYVIRYIPLIMGLDLISCSQTKQNMYRKPYYYRNPTTGTCVGRKFRKSPFACT